MDVRIKLHILADAAKYDASCASSGSKRAGNGVGLGNSDGTGICHSYTPDGRCVSLLKILLTNYCVYDCQYCVNRVTSDTPRARFSIEEVVNLTLDFYKRNYVEGLFLSSGIIQSVDHTMEELVEVARRLREDHLFNGYIHLKAVPGASPELLAKAGRYADRLSANVELPRALDLQRLAPEKKPADIDASMGTIATNIAAAREESARAPHVHAGLRGVGAPYASGQSTQMIVGATDATDRDILHTATRLYRRHRLKRVYYSAFSPIPHGSGLLPGKAPPLVREHRLYQADWLVRYYGFEAHELTDNTVPNLDLDIDPKLAWALRQRATFPIDINRAPRELLLRIPGIGYRNVDRILQARRFRTLTFADLAKLRVQVRKAAPFILAAGAASADARLIDSPKLVSRVRPADPQLELFAAAGAARSGEL